MKKITVRRMAEECGFSVLAGADALDREADRVFCWRPIELCYGPRPADSAWVTVMGNVNAVAVAVLADTACIVLAENAPLDGEARSGLTDRECLYWDPLIQFSIPGF